MTKLIAILAVLAVLPVSALAGEVRTDSKAIHCAKDSADQSVVTSSSASVASSSNDAQIAQ